MHLESLFLLDIENPIHRTCLFLVYQPRIQSSLDRTLASWNVHKMRTMKYKSPLAIYELSKTAAMNAGYWDSDPGDTITDASHPDYGRDPGAPNPPHEDQRDDGMGVGMDQSAESCVDYDKELSAIQEILEDLDIDTNRDDDNWGIEVYCDAVLGVESYFVQQQDVDN